MASLHEEDAITLQMKGKSMAQRTDILRNLKRHTLRHLASRLVNVVRQGGRLKTYSFSDF